MLFDQPNSVYTW